MNDKAGVAPVIRRLHPGLDQGQLELIGHLDGPTRGIAGPGTGKTLAVALRGTNILLQDLAAPEELVLCTYSRAAARELRQRFITLATTPAAAGTFPGCASAPSMACPAGSCGPTPGGPVSGLVLQC